MRSPIENPGDSHAGRAESDRACSRGSRPSGRKYGQAQPAPAQRRGASDDQLTGATHDPITLTKGGSNCTIKTRTRCGITGSAANSVMRLRRVQDDAFAEKVKAGAAVHLALDHLKSYVESGRMGDHVRPV